MKKIPVLLQLLSLLLYGKLWVLVVGASCLIAFGIVSITYCYGKPHTIGMAFHYTPYWGWILFVVGFILSIYIFFTER